MSLFHSLSALDIRCFRSHEPITKPGLTHLIVLDRQDKQRQWLSGYFQDIDRPGYPYFINQNQGKILDISPALLFSHFKSFDWTSYEQFQIEPILNWLKRSYDLLIEPRKWGLYRQEKENGIALVYISLEELIAQPSIIAKFLGLSPDFQLARHNIGEEKWYAPLYNQLKVLQDQERAARPAN